MVIPWLGFSLAKLLKEVEPTVRRQVRAVRDAARPAADARPAKSDWYHWPYVEGLRLDEAMNDLTLLSTGLYGKQLCPQNGAPIRLVVPWKYGFKSIKSIVKIDLVTEQPTSLWMTAAPERVRLLRQRQPGRVAPALVAGQRAAHRRDRPARDAAVQRLRRAGGEPLRRHGLTG